MAFTKLIAQCEIRKIKKIDPEAPIDVTNVTHAVSKDVEYFQKNLMPNASGQVVNYTWEKSSEESPSFYKQHEIIFDKEDLSLKMHKNTLDQMATTKGYAHGYTHNEWDTVSNDPPVCQSDKPKRYGIHLSSMTQ